MSNPALYIFLISSKISIKLSKSREELFHKKGTVKSVSFNKSSLSALRWSFNINARQSEGSIVVKISQTVLQCDLKQEIDN